jgi:hypothetical protein
MTYIPLTEARDEGHGEKLRRAELALQAAVVALHAIWDACDSRTSLHRTARAEITLTSEEDPAHAIVVRRDQNDDLWLVVDRRARLVDVNEPADVLRSRITRVALQWAARHRLGRRPNQKR